MSQEKKEIGARIRAIRIDAGLNQEQFGSKIGVGKSTVSAYEKGDAFPTLQVLRKIAAVGGKTHDWIIEGGEHVQESHAEYKAVKPPLKNLTPQEEGLLKLVREDPDAAEMFELYLSLPRSKRKRHIADMIGSLEEIKEKEGT